MKRLTIAEVSERFGTSPDTLRYYERVGLIPPVGRKGGMRNYDESDIKWIEFILCMRSAGVPIEKLVRYVACLSWKRKNARPCMECPPCSSPCSNTAPFF